MRYPHFTTLILSLAFLILPPAIAPAKEIKEPDSYAYTRGVEAINADNYEEAEEWFTRELSEHPDNGYAYLYMATLQHYKQQPGKAFESIQKALKRLPKKDKDWTAAAYMLRSRYHAEMEDTLSAIADQTTALKIKPDHTGLLKERGDLYFEMNRFDLSDADFRKIMELEPGDVIGYMGVGRNALRNDRTQEAIDLFSKAIKFDPGYSAGYAFRAEGYSKLGKWHEAADDIVKALNIDHNDKAFYLMKEIPKEALPIMETKLKVMATKDPTESYWPYCLGSLALGNEQYEKAIDFYNESFRLEADPLALDRISLCYLNLDRDREALDAAQRAIDINPQARFIDLKATALEKLGRFNEALIERNTLVEQYPEFAQAYRDRAEIYLALRKFDKALEDINTAAIVAPELEEFPHFLLKRADINRFLGNNDQARKDYDKMIEIEKDSTLTVDSWIPFAYSNTGERDKAIETMKYIVEKDTTDSIGSQYNLACVYARLDMKREALDALRDAVDKGYRNKGHIIADYDLDPIRDMPEFDVLLEHLDSLLPDDKTDNGDTEEGNIEIVEIPFSKEYGVTTVKCHINDLPLHFVFDTGASDVTLSMVEANFMLKNKYIDNADVIGSARYIDANGDVTEGTVINLRKVNFGGLELDNVRASVVRNQKAPLLLGQSVLGRLGKIEIDNQNQKLVVTHRVK